MSVRSVRDHVTVGVAQWLAMPGEADENVRTACDLIDDLATDGAELIVLPEFWLCGFDRESFVEDVRRCAQPLDGPAVERLRRSARAHGLHLVAGTIPEQDGERCFNTAVMIGPDGELIARHRKAHLYGELEQQCFVPGNSLTVIEGTPFGTIGLSVCFDGDFPETARAMRERGVRLVLQPAAYDEPAESWWDRLYPAHALVNGQWWVLANQAGSHRSTSLFGRSCVIAPDGAVVAEAVRAAPGTTPAPATLIVPIPLQTVDGGPPQDGDILFTERRSDLKVRTYTAASQPRERERPSR